MDHKDRFPEAFHFMNETYSFWWRPCRFEQSSQPPVKTEKSSQPPIKTSAKRECPFKNYCDSIQREDPKDSKGSEDLKDFKGSEDSVRGKVDDMLEDIFGKWFKTTLAEPTASIITRSEHHHNQNSGFRLSLRKHIYAVRKCDPKRLGFKCSEIEKDDEFSQYLGFVDLRYEHTLFPEKKPITLKIKSPVALGLLVPPDRLTKDPTVTLITGNYGAYFGAHSFVSSPYCTQDDNFGGAVCAQMSICMTLGMLIDRGSKIDGSFSLTFKANYPFLPEQSPFKSCTEHTSQIAGIQPSEIAGAFKPTAGLTSIQCLDLLEKYDASPALIRLPKNESSLDFDRKIIWHTLNAYINARFPIILFVAPKEPYYKKDVRPDEKIQEGQEPKGHAVTMIGTQASYTNDALEGAKVITHDPAGIPFYITPFFDILEATWNYPGLKGHAQFLVCGDKRIKSHVWDLVQYLKNKDYITKSCSLDIRLYTGADYLKSFPEEPFNNGDHAISVDPTKRYWVFNVGVPDVLGMFHYLADAESADPFDAIKMLRMYLQPKHEETQDNAQPK